MRSGLKDVAIANRHLIEQAMTTYQFALYERAIAVIDSCTGVQQLPYALQYSILASDKANYPFIMYGFIEDKIASLGGRSL